MKMKIGQKNKVLEISKTNKYSKFYLLTLFVSMATWRFQNSHISTLLNISDFLW